MTTPHPDIILTNGTIVTLDKKGAIASSLAIKNRRILAELNPEGKSQVHRDKLVERGFKFSYFTNEYRTKSGNVYRFCYDQGYLERDQGYVTLVVRQEYVE